ncbi:TetR/AcrR family transcriptional regulator [Dyella mobilis]|uniref:TetR family transcriptional regulator n=1 Tax=Dyella mobilis TaxID=1849582 RepID=A0ABS2KD04_9GAMM|nr:TetR/AcrR family transcriptional regulator [Dyella mobilis]MBM7129054.1 TetR family transcriptional regulator [Dyella mobilis]GLQ99245.1 TetR family transcriptional regulator [Dyella mobilis]
MTTENLGRRERKKAATRQAIADAALTLFLERGYDAVSIKDVADAADVSVTTVFKHFSGKEALVFDLDQEMETGFVEAVQTRPSDQSVVDALHDHILALWRAFEGHSQRNQFVALIDSTPVLRAYADRMWTRHTKTLGTALAKELGQDANDPTCRAAARLILDIPALTRDGADSEAAIRAVFSLLRDGWSDGNRRFN